MKIVVLSDTHGNYPLAVRAIEEAGTTDQIVHLGDEVEDARLIEQFIGRDLIKISGNCDLHSSEPKEICRSMAGMRVFLTHGDRYYVKSGLAHLYKKALAEKADIVLYGHSHIAAVNSINGILFINPGSMNRNGTKASCAVVTISEGKVTAEILPFEL